MSNSLHQRVEALERIRIGIGRDVLESGRLGELEQLLVRFVVLRQAIDAVRARPQAESFHLVVHLGDLLGRALRVVHAAVELDVAHVQVVAVHQGVVDREAAQRIDLDADRVAGLLGGTGAREPRTTKRKFRRRRRPIVCRKRRRVKGST